MLNLLFGAKIEVVVFMTSITVFLHSFAAEQVLTVIMMSLPWEDVTLILLPDLVDWSIITQILFVSMKTMNLKISTQICKLKKEVVIILVVFHLIIDCQDCNLQL